MFVQNSGNMKFPGNAWKKVGAAGSLGFTLVVSTFTGLALGYWLDHLLETSPKLTVTCLLAGIAMGFFNMIYYGLTHKNGAS